MQKLVVKGQFMAVRSCEIEMSRFLLLIGEQASGKSTIAKLIYFFQTLPDAIYEGIIAANGKNIYDLKANIGRKFSELFGGSNSGYSGEVKTEGLIYEIRFRYSASHSLKILATFAWINYEIEDDLKKGIDLAIENYKSATKLKQERVDEINARQNLKIELDNLFSRDNTEHTYLIAGRSVTTAYPDIFEKAVESELKILLEEEVKGQNLEIQLRSGSEQLLYQFVQWSKTVRAVFSQKGGTFSNAVLKLDNHKEALLKMSSIATKVLKGEYESSPSPSLDETIKVKTAEGGYALIKMKDASSGQQEILRILQGLFLAIGSDNRREFFVIEEPEAHLYPLAQKEVMNAFAVFLNTIPQGRLIVTTHSPYILACVNILLFATFVAGRVNGQSDKIAVPKEYWLDANDFTAYSLSGEDQYCTDIKNPKTGLVSQNYLDKISEELGTQYHQLYDLLTLSPK